MKIDQLTYFLETAKLEHIGKAAKVLAISPSAISHSIAALEEEIGSSLFEKKGKRIFLTEKGKLFKLRCQEILDHITEVTNEITADNIILPGHYKLAASHGLCAKILTPAWSKLASQNNKMTAEIYTMRSAQVIADVASGEYDLGVCFSPQPHPDLEIKTIYEGQLYPYFKAGHPYFKKSKNNLEDLNKFRATSPKAFLGIDVCESHPMFKKYKIIPQADCLFDSYDVAVENILASGSWGLLPDLVATWWGKKLAQVEVPKAWQAPYQVSVVYSRNRSLPRNLLNLVQALEQL